MASCRSPWGRAGAPARGSVRRRRENQRSGKPRRRGRPRRSGPARKSDAGGRRTLSESSPFDLASFGIGQKLQQLPRGGNENQGGRSGRQTAVAGGRGRKQTAGQDFVTSLLPSAPASCRLTHGLLLTASRACMRRRISRAL